MTWTPQLTAEFEMVRVEFEKVEAEIRRKHSEAINNLTRDQFISAMEQAIACGDFQRQIRFPDNSQTVTYLPFRMVEELKSRIRELEDYISELESEVSNLRLCSDE